MTSTFDIQTVSFTSPDAPAAFTRSLRETGFAVLTDHPIDPVRIEAHYMLDAVTGWQQATMHPTSNPVLNVATSRAGESYRYRVTALDSAEPPNESAWSEPQSISVGRF